MLEFLIPSTFDEGLDPLLHRLARAALDAPFSDATIEFVGDLSRQILADKAYRGFPELMAMAHWFRPVNLLRMKSDFQAGANESNKYFVSKGLVFHLAPSNVDSVFIYSWLLSLLCGNANIVRVSRRRTAQMQLFFQTVNALLKRECFNALGTRNAVVSFDHDAAMTALISSHCQLRVIWGGNATVVQIRAIPLPPLSSEIAFANRFSLAVIKSAAVIGLDASGLRDLAHDFYNDAFWFNQQACSSPKAVIWIGERAMNEQAQHILWAALADEINAQSPDNSAAYVMNRVTTLYRYAHDHDDAVCMSGIGALPSRIFLPSMDEADRRCHEGSGVFIELYRSDLAQVVSLLTPTDQTICHFGFKQEEWVSVLPHFPPHAADRIVPIGQALAFGQIWDGVDLLRAFTREMQIKGSGA